MSLLGGVRRNTVNISHLYEIILVSYIASLKLSHSSNHFPNLIINNNFEPIFISGLMVHNNTQMARDSLQLQVC